MASNHLLSRLPFQLPFKLSSNAKSACSHHRQSTTIEGDDEADHSAPLLETSPPPKFPHSNNNFVFYFSLALALLSAINVALLPATLSKYQACSFSDTAHGDAAVSSAWTAKTTTSHPSVYEHVWPDRIARVSRKLKQAVWGHGVQFYVTVEVRHPYPPFTQPSPPTHTYRPVANHTAAGFHHHALPHPLYRRPDLRAPLAAASGVICSCRRPHDERRCEGN